jgi:tetratricopeptide (TPR) repeat protein
MKDKLSIIAVMVFFAAVSGGTGWAIEYSTVRSPVGFGAFRPSDPRSGLVRSPNPIDPSGNLVITGNVRGGRDFRGIVPYQASTDFRAVTGSSSLDSFLRDSAGFESLGRYTGANRPFFSPSRTVTTTRPGQARVIGPPTMVIGRPAANSEAIKNLPYLSSRQSMLYDGRYISGSGFRDLDFASFQMQKSVLRIPTIVHEMGVRRPMSMTLSEMERAILAEVGIPILQDKDRMETRREAVAPRETWREQFRIELEGVERTDAEFKESLVGEEGESLRLRTDKKRGPQLDVYEDMEQQIDELQKSYEELMAAEVAKRALGATKGVWEREEAGDGEKESSEESFSSVGSVSVKSGEVEPGHSKVEGVMSDSGRLAWPPSERLVTDRVRASGAERALGGIESSARAKAILGPHKSVASFWDEKFNQHIVAGERYLKEGKYYRSADAYTLALIYKPEEPLAYLGKSHALFTAGEYMSSALFLSRGVTAAGEGSEKKDYEIQQLLALGSKLLTSIDKDKIENRVVDLEGWQQRSGSAELQFLLGYIYYQMGRLDAAREAIDGAYEKMPEEPAAILLKKTVDRAKSKTSTSNGVKSKKQPHQD